MIHIPNALNILDRDVESPSLMTMKHWLLYLPWPQTLQICVSCAQSI